MSVEMKARAHETTQAMQRVKVGMTGLAIVLLLIGLASVVFSAANRNSAVRPGAIANSEIAANVALGNSADSLNEPLTELGVSPATQTDQPPAKHTAGSR